MVPINNNQLHLGKNNTEVVIAILPNSGKANDKVVRIKEYHAFEEHNYFKKSKEVQKVHRVHLMWMESNASKFNNSIVQDKINEEKIKIKNEVIENELENCSNPLNIETSVIKDKVNKKKRKRKANVTVKASDNGSDPLDLGSSVIKKKVNKKKRKRKANATVEASDNGSDPLDLEKIEIKDEVIMNTLENCPNLLDAEKIEIKDEVIMNTLENCPNLLDAEINVKKEIILFDTKPLDESGYSDMIAESDPLEFLDPLNTQPLNPVDVEQTNIPNEPFIFKMERLLEKISQNEENVHEPESNEIVEPSKDRIKELINLQCKKCLEKTDNITQGNMNSCSNCQSQDVCIVCLKCDRQFCSLRFLRAHVQSSVVHDIYELVDVDTFIKASTRCQRCGKRYANEAFLKEHLTECKAYHCPMCRRQSKLHFTSLAKLKIHMQNTHLENYNYECKLCGKTWATKIGFQRHSLICPFRGTTKDFLKKLFDNGVTVKCHHCSFRSSNYIGAQNHYVKTHFVFDPKQDWNWYFKWIKPTVDHIPLNCHHCKFRTFKKKAIIKHIKEKHKKKKFKSKY